MGRQPGLAWEVHPTGAAELRINRIGIRWWRQAAICGGSWPLCPLDSAMAAAAQSQDRSTREPGWSLGPGASGTESSERRLAARKEPWPGPQGPDAADSPMFHCPAGRLPRQGLLGPGWGWTGHQPLFTRPPRSSGCASPLPGPSPASPQYAPLLGGPQGTSVQTEGWAGRGGRCAVPSLCRCSFGRGGPTETVGGGHPTGPLPRGSHSKPRPEQLTPLSGTPKPAEGLGQDGGAVSPTVPGTSRGPRGGGWGLLGCALTHGDDASPPGRPTPKPRASVSDS